MLSPPIVLQSPYGLIPLPPVVTSQILALLLAQHSPPPFPPSVQVLHALIITQQGGVLFPTTFLMDRSFTVPLNILSMKDILGITPMGIRLEEFLIKSSKIMVR